MRAEIGPKFKSGDIVHNWLIGAVHHKSKGSNGAYNYHYWAECTCGASQQVSQKLLLSGQSKSCRSCSAKNLQLETVKQSGERFGKLIIIRDTGDRSGRHRIYECVCDCGNIVLKRNDYLTTLAPCCGCTYKDKIGKPKGTSHKNTIYAAYRYNARKRGIEFLLSKDEFFDLATKNCFYCCAAPEYQYTSHNSNGHIKITGVDRYYNDRGYTKANCVPCCKQCNRAKGPMTPENFRKWALSVKENMVLLD